MANILTQTPAQLGYRFPAEWEKHTATWLSWIHKEASWPGKLESVYPVYSQFIKIMTAGEIVRINVADEAMKNSAIAHLLAQNVDLSKVEFLCTPPTTLGAETMAPAFVVNPTAAHKSFVVDWGYNAWGDKYPPYDLDDVVPTRIAEYFGLPLFYPEIVMEGGSVEFNGRGTLMTSKACLLNPNRNPHLSQAQIEQKLRDFYGVEHILWLGDGIVGDDTDGHIDDITRFVNADTVVTVIEHDKSDENYEPLKENAELLATMRLENGKANVIELPMPKPVIYDDQRLPASYANFYIANAAVIVPTYRDDENDQKALDVLTACFPDRQVIGLDSTDLVWDWEVSIV